MRSISGCCSQIKEDIKEEKQEITRQDIELEQTSLFITEITKEEYKKIYQEYLKNNNLEDNDISKKVFDISNKNKYKIIEKKIYTVDDIDPNLLLSKNGKKLFGGALQTRINKILDEMNKKEGIVYILFSFSSTVNGLL